MNKYISIHIKHFAPLIFLLCALTFSCEHESKQEPFNTPDDPAIAIAKTWYEGWLQDNRTLSEMYPSVKGAEDSKQFLFKVKGEPLWLLAHVGVDGVVEVPMTISQGVSLSADKNPTEAQLSSTVTRLLILRDDGGCFYQVYMHIQADAGYLSSRNNNLQNNYYKQVAPDFTGRVFYSSAEGVFINGWGYIDGKLITAITKMEPTTDKSVEMPKTKTVPVCYSVLIFVYEQTCYYTLYNLIGCTPWGFIGEMEITVCGDYDPNNGGNPNGGGTPKVFSISLNADPSVGGTLSGAGSYLQNTPIEISSSVNSGYSFLGWFEGSSVLTHSPKYQFTVASNRAIKGSFVLTNSDCGKLAAVAKDTTVNGYMDRLIDGPMLSNPFQEHGDLKRANGTYQTKTGDDHKVTTTFESGTKYTHSFHSHTSSYAIASSGDLWSLWKTYSGNHMQNTSDFVYGMVGSTSSMLIKIENLGTFQSYFNNLTEDDLKNKYDVAIDPNNPQLSMETFQLRAAQFCAQMGLKVMVSNVYENNDYYSTRQWQGFSTSNGVFVKTDCK